MTDPFLSDIHCGDTIFTHTPFPHLGSGFHFVLCVKFPLFLFLWKKNCYLGRVILEGVLR